jgi:aspartate carbamoyltransferase catalytic subunit
VKNLISIADLGRDGIIEVLDVAESFAEVERRTMKKVPALKGKVVATVFFEESTRTRLSFETAAKRLSADVLSLSVASSSVKKGESLKDTLMTIEALGIDAVIIRHRSSGAPEQVTRWLSDISVINAGDGWHEHPSQGLLDAFTVRQAWADDLGVAARDTGSELFAGKRIVIVGDIAHSRVARSETLAYRALGAEVIWCAPQTLLPHDASQFDVRITHDLDAELEAADLISVLRLQAERGSGDCVPTLREFNADFAMTTKRLRSMKVGARVTHPGPMVRGVEISSEVADDPRCLVTTQVTNGVAVRMAVLYLLLTGGAHGLEGVGQ